jgi:hypothetical protein
MRQLRLAPRKPVMKHDASVKGLMMLRKCPLKRLVTFYTISPNVLPEIDGQMKR